MQKQNVNISFDKGVDTKTDPFQLAVGKFLSIVNAVFDIIGRLKKRNGFGYLAALPNSSSTYITTFNGNLTAIGTSFRALSAGSSQWINKGSIQPAELSVLPITRNNVNQTQSDAAVASNGLVCTVYTNVAGSTTTYKYVVTDSITGQNIIPPTNIPVASGTVTGSPRVFLLGRNFIVVFTNVITAVSHLQYVAISVQDPTIVSGNTDIASSYIPATTLSWDGYVANSALYIAYNTTTGGQSVKVTSLNQNLTLTTAKTFAGSIATIISVTADETTPANPIVWVTMYNSATTSATSLAVDKNLNTVLAPTAAISGVGSIVNVTTVATNGVRTAYYEIATNYSYAAIASNAIRISNLTQAGVVTAGAVVRSVGIASKAFLVNGTQYFLGAYQSPYQSTYFLINGSGNVVGKLAYSNGVGYCTAGLPSVTVTDNVAQFTYLLKTTITPVNKNTNVPSGTQIAGIYSQTGINLATFTIGTSNIISAEIGSNLNLSGGIVWAYDGSTPVEQGFNVWPDSVVSTTVTGSGSIAAGTYYYVATYEWSDNQGNLFRSAPSIPISQVTTTASSTNTVNVPYLRLTYKISNPVKIVLYRWSTTQPVYYQVTSVTFPTLNDPTLDSIAISDTSPDATILGNSILYTNGGVLENIGPPAAKSVFLFDSRLWMIPSENPNSLQFSKQVIQNTPVEMSDLLSAFISPTTAAQGSSGELQCGAPMDDKLILFKRDAIYYINGQGPDNTGSNNGYSQPIFITSTVGCSNQKSIVFTPLGLMFQSDKGIWLLGRDLSTKYIGADVEAFNSSVVNSSVNVPGTNQVRFELDTGEMLMYDYYVKQWGPFEGASSISSTLYQNLHTYLDSSGRVFQETPGKYLDGSSPVLMSFTTSWVNLAGLQGYQRIYQFNFLGEYVSPHKLSVQVAYDYQSPTQQATFSPSNYAGTWGSDQNWGGSSVWGGSSPIENFRVFTKTQKCQSFQISVQETFDSSFGTIAGAGLTLSGINCTVGIKSGSSPTAGSKSIG